MTGGIGLKACLKTELKKALFQKSTYGITLLLVVLALVHAKTSIEYGIAGLTGHVFGNPQITMGSAYVHWLGGDVGSFENAVFFFLFPIFVAIPFGWSLAGEIRSGYTAQMIARTGRKNYFPAKLIAVFLSGAVVVMIPLIVSFLIVSMYLPSLTPELCYPYGGLLQRSMWTSLYYAHPLVYTILYILLDGVYGGLFASLCVAVAFRVKYRTMVVLVPFCLYTVLEYLDSNFVVAMRLGYDTSPAKFLRPMAIANEHSGLIICAEAVLLLALAVLPTLRKGRKYEAI